MRIFIEKVHIGSCFQDSIGDFTIVAKLTNQKTIEIFDMYYDLRNFEKKEMEVLVEAFLPRDITEKDKESKSRPIITGNFIQNYEIEEKWFLIDEKLKKYKNHWSAVNTEFGTILVDHNDGNYLTKDEENKVTFIEGRIDLIAWRNIP